MPYSQDVIFRSEKLLDKSGPELQIACYAYGSGKSALKPLASSIPTLTMSSAYIRLTLHADMRFKRAMLPC